MKIPCETIARLAILRGEGIFASLRLDNGCVIASNRRFMAVERVPPFQGVAHIAVDDALIEQCRTEAQYASTIEITPNHALKFTVGKTTLGFVTGNIGVFDSFGDFDRWRAVIAPCAEPLTASAGAMIFDTPELAQLVASAPSGAVVFETHINPDARPVLVRDINSPDWCGCFLPRLADGLHHAPAALPGWLK